MKKQRWEESEKRTEEERRSEKRKRQKTEDAGAWKDSKVAKHCVFPMICGSGGSKSRLAKAAGAEPSGQMRDEKLHTVVARSTFWSQVRSTFGSWDVEKSARRCGAKHISKWKCTKHTMLGALLEVKMMKKCTPVWREAHSQLKCTKHTMLGVEKAHAVVARSTCPSQHVSTCSDHFWRFRRDFAWQAQGILHLAKSEKTWGFCSSFKNDGRRGTFQEVLQRCISRGRRSTRDMFIRDVRRSGRRFPERGCTLEHQILRFAKIILRDGCSTSYDLVSPFRGRRNTLDRWNAKSQNALVWGGQLCT